MAKVKELQARLDELNRLELEKGEDGRMKKVSDFQKKAKSKNGILDSIKEGFKDGKDKAKKEAAKKRASRLTSDDDIQDELTKQFGLEFDNDYYSDDDQDSQDVQDDWDSQDDQDIQDDWDNQDDQDEDIQNTDDAQNLQDTRSAQAAQDAQDTQTVSPPQQSPANKRRVMVLPFKSLHPEGPGIGYKYWDYEVREWAFTSQIFVAAQASDLWQPIYVWYGKEGEIKRLLTKREMQRYFP